MHKVLVAGAGKIGSLIAVLLCQSKDYEVHIADISFSGSDIARVLKQDEFKKIQCHELDIKNKTAFSQFIDANPVKTLISCLPYFLNDKLADLAKEFQLNYFDLTEDTEITAKVKALAQNATTAFVPQCGLAPGFISIAANSLISGFEEAHTAKLRVGALPQHSNNALQYALTWSTEGLINEYGKTCQALVNGKLVSTNPLEDLESIQLDGLSYEAFNTSGGLGSLAELKQNKVQHLNYKTIRYPGHCEKMRFLMNDLKLNDDRALLKEILERAIPKTYQDVVVIYVSVNGYKKGILTEESYYKKVYPEAIAGLTWSAIQVTTAAGLCTVVDSVLSSKEKYQGFVYQEKFSLEAFCQNRFGRYFA